MATRIPRTRKKGSKLPPGTVCCTRGTKWGNPFEIGVHGTRDEVIDMFRSRLYSTPYLLAALRHDLSEAKYLACWCPLTVACHVDVILEALERGKNADD